MTSNKIFFLRHRNHPIRKFAFLSRERCNRRKESSGRLLPILIGRTALGPGFVAKATHPSLGPFLKEKEYSNIRSGRERALPIADASSFPKKSPENIGRENKEKDNML